MNDMQFSAKEEQRLQDLEDRADAEEQAMVDELGAEAMVDYEAMMVAEAEEDAYQRGVDVAVEGMESLGIASAEEVAEIAEKYGVTI